MVSFLKDFDICPSLVNFTLGQSLFKETLELGDDYLSQHFTFPNMLERDKGIIFTLKRFLVYLIRISLVGFPSLFPQFPKAGEPQTRLKQQDKLTLLLEKMELSKGFIEFKKATSLINSDSLTLVPITSVLRKVKAMIYLINKFLLIAFTKDIKSKEISRNPS